jgi:hypothetical protein
MPVIPSYTANNSIPSLGAATASGWGEPMGKVATQLAAQGKALADVSNKIADAVAGFGYPKTAGQGDVFGELGKSAGESWKYGADRETKKAEKELDDAQKKADEKKKKAEGTGKKSSGSDQFPSIVV